MRSANSIRLAVGGAIVAALLLATAGSAAAKSFAPPHHRIFHGVSDTSNNRDFHRFAKRVGAHPAVLEDFYHWDTPLTTGALKRWHKTRTRGVLSLSTAAGVGPERINPRQIAKGKGDHYLVRLNQSIVRSHQVVYIRPFGEMNGSWNPYCAYNSDGTRHGRSHSTRKFRRAWRRMVLIVRGGKVKKINHKLRKRAHAADPARSLEPLPRLRAAQHPPPPRARQGRLHVVAADDRLTRGEGQPPRRLLARQALRRLGRRRHLLEVRHPGDLGGLQALLPPLEPSAVRGRRVLAVDNDYRGRFTHKLFHWAKKHHRVRMLIYYRSVSAGTLYDINHWPGRER